MMTYRRW